MTGMSWSRQQIRGKQHPHGLSNAHPCRGPHAPTHVTPLQPWEACRQVIPCCKAALILSDEGMHFCLAASLSSWPSTTASSITRTSHALCATTPCKQCCWISSSCERHLHQLHAECWTCISQPVHATHVAGSLRTRMIACSMHLWLPVLCCTIPFACHQPLSRTACRLQLKCTEEL